MSRTMHAIEYDAVHDEIVVGQQLGQAILTFRGSATGQEAPIRVIQGPNTQLRRPDQVAVDPLHDEIFVPEGDRILVFPRGASGDVAPIRIIQGSNTRLEPTTGSSPPIAVDPVHNVIVVVMDDAVVTFNRLDSGNVKPRTVIQGSSFKMRSRGVGVYPEGGLIFAFVTQPGNEQSKYIGVWSHEDTGDVPPRWKIGEAGGLLRQPRGLTVDARNKSVIASDKASNSILTFLVPEIF